MKTEKDLAATSAEGKDTGCFFWKLPDPTMGKKRAEKKTHLVTELRR